MTHLVVGKYAYSYYGTYERKKPKLGIHYFMLDEHVKSMVEKEKLKFADEMNKMIKDSSDKILNELKKSNDVIKTTTKKIDEFRRFLINVIEINQLESPKVDEKKSKKKVKKKPIMEYNNL